MVVQRPGSGARVGTAVRRLMSTLCRDLAIVGAAFYGSAEILAAVRQTSDGPPDEDRSSEAVAREIAEGIAELEDFLAQQACDPRAPRRRTRPRRPTRGR
jgi:hypothetical protein